MIGRSRTFCTIFPNYRDFHFYKDPGQIPYRLTKLGYDASVVCYQGEDELAVTVKHLKVVRIADSFINRWFNSGFAGYLVRNAGKIDILNVYHYSWPSLFFAFIYKIFNRRGFVYLKLDHSAFVSKLQVTESNKKSYLPDIGGPGLRGKVKRYITGRIFAWQIDLWSVEDQLSKELLETGYDFLRGRIITVFNGHSSDLQGPDTFCDPALKEDIFLTSGRLGTFQKATEVLLNAFRLVAKQVGWTLHLAGPVEPSFMDFLESFFQDNPLLADRVKVHGQLGREELNGLYCRSSVLCMPSRFEGFALVFPEAMYYGNAIITTSNTSLKPLTEKYKFGLIVERDDPKALAEAMIRLADDRELLKEMSANARKIASSHLS